MTMHWKRTEYSVFNRNGTFTPDFFDREDRGLLHRAEGPAKSIVDLESGIVVDESWFHGGVAHRDPAIGPSHIWRNPKTGIVTYEEYRSGGRLHRNPADGPARIRLEQDGRTTREHYVHGIRLDFAPAEPDSVSSTSSGAASGDPGPAPASPPSAFLELRSDSYWMVDYAEGFAMLSSLHRVDGPAHTVAAQETGIILEEAYYQQGQLHRDPLEGPALIWRDSTSGRVLGEYYYVHGDKHRDPQQGPATREWNPATGELEREDYYRDGEFVRAEGPRRSHPPRISRHAGEPDPSPT